MRPGLPQRDSILGDYDDLGVVRGEAHTLPESRAVSDRLSRSATVAWGGETGKQLGLDPGPGNETAEEVRLWARHLEAAGVEAVEEA